MNVLMWAAAAWAIQDYTAFHVGERIPGSPHSWWRRGRDSSCMSPSHRRICGVLPLSRWSCGRTGGCSGERSTARDHFLFGGVLALALLTYDVFAVLAYLIAYTVITRRSVARVLLPIAGAVFCYILFGMLTAPMTSMVHDRADSNYLWISVNNAIAVLRANPISFAAYKVYAMAAPNYIANLGNTVFVFPLLLAVAGVFALKNARAAQVVGALLLPSALNCAVLYFGGTELATYARFSYIGYPAVYLLCGACVAAVGAYLERHVRWGYGATAAIVIIVHILLTNSDAFGHPWLYYMFYYQHPPPV